MRPPDRDRSKDERIQIARSGLTLRQLARDMGVPVIVISWINWVSYQTGEGIPHEREAANHDLDTDEGADDSGEAAGEERPLHERSRERLGHNPTAEGC